MDTNTFNERVITKFTDELTDRIFQFILDDDDLMCQYLDMISEHNRKTVNSQLGKAIKNRFGVDNIDENGNVMKGEPNCVLIKSKYSRYKL